MPKSREYVKKRGNKRTNETQTTRSRFNFGTASYILSERLSLHAVYYTPQGSRRTTLYLGMGEPQNQDARVHYALGVVHIPKNEPVGFFVQRYFCDCDLLLDPNDSEKRPLACPRRHIEYVRMCSEMASYSGNGNGGTQKWHLIPEMAMGVCPIAISGIRCHF